MVLSELKSSNRREIERKRWAKNWRLICTKAREKMNLKKHVFRFSVNTEAENERILWEIDSIKHNLWFWWLITKQVNTRRCGKFHSLLYSSLKIFMSVYRMMGKKYAWWTDPNRNSTCSVPKANIFWAFLRYSISN